MAGPRLAGVCRGAFLWGLPGLDGSLCAGQGVVVPVLLCSLVSRTRGVWGLCSMGVGVALGGVASAFRQAIGRHSAGILSK